MTIQKIQLRDDNQKIFLTAMILHESQEFNAGKKRPAVLICPGGGYLATSDRESEPVALRFLAKGYNAFIVRYSTDDRGKALFPAPLIDAAKAMNIIKEKSDEFLTDPKKVAICGFSAGGNLAGLLATRWHENFLSKELGKENESFRPALLISSYGMLNYPDLMDMAKKDPDGETLREWGSKMGLWRKCNKTLLGSTDPSLEQMEEVSPVHHVDERTPPSFLWHTAEDDLVYPQNSLDFASALGKAGIPYELHLYETGGHGLSLADRTSSGADWQINPDCSGWIDLCIKWMNRHFDWE